MKGIGPGQSRIRAAKGQGVKCRGGESLGNRAGATSVCVARGQVA